MRRSIFVKTDISTLVLISHLVFDLPVILLLALEADLDEGQEHTVVLYYVVSSDGDTIIYNERTESDTYTEKQRVTPKQGRVVIFDGGLYHTAQQCKDKIRCIANYNIA